MSSVNLEEEFGKLVAENLRCQSNLETLINEQTLLSCESRDLLKLKAVACRFNVNKIIAELQMNFQSKWIVVETAGQKCHIHAVMK